MMRFGGHNPYTIIRQQAAEIEKLSGQLQQDKQSHDASIRKALATMRDLRMDVGLTMAIIKEVRPWCYPGTLDTIVRDKIIRHGVGHATMDLVSMIEDTRQGFFIPIAKPGPQIADKRPYTPVTEATKESGAFGDEEVEEEGEF